MELVKQWLISQRHRWVLWVPVLLAAGAGAYYSLPREPNWWEMAAIPHLAIAIAFCYRRRWHLGAAIFSLLLLTLFGTLMAFWHTQRLDTHMVTQEVPMQPMQGRIKVIETTDKGLRVTFDQLTLEGFSQRTTPQHIRIRLRGVDEALLEVGQHISFRAALMPPAGPVMPGGFDFARFFYFRGIGGVGYGAGPIKLLEPAPESFFSNLSIAWQAMRERISARINNAVGAPAGPIAAALMIGDRAGIDEHSNTIMRETNLSHLLAISGLHMAMITGWVFALVRWGLLIPPRMRHYPHIKEAAAIAAMMAGLFYLLIADIPLSAARAYIMVLCIFGAILIHRQAAPMRSLALAAVLLILYDPSNILEPGFQLSFIATCALIAVYENLRERIATREIDYGIVMKAVFFFGATLLTTLIAELATGPLVAYHFGLLSLYGMLANVLVMPLVTFLIMPALVISFFLMPLGLEAPSFYVMEQGILWMMRIAQSVSEIPGASYRISGIDTVSMMTVIAGFFWLALWQGKWRYIGVPVMCIALFIGSVSQHHPQLLISHDLKQIAAEIDGEHQLIRGRDGYFISSQWAEGMGMKRMEEASQAEAYRCDALGCTLHFGEINVALPYVKSALKKDCLSASIIIASFSIGENACQNAAHLLDRNFFKRNGGAWLWLSKKGIDMGTTSRTQGARPWNRFTQK